VSFSISPVTTRVILLTLCRDHLKDVHEYSQEYCDLELNFKLKKFKDRKGIEAKGKLAYSIIFDVPEDQIPSLLVTDEDAEMNLPSTKDSQASETLQEVFKMLRENRRADILREFPKILAILPKCCTAGIVELGSHCLEEKLDAHSPGDAALGPIKWNHRLSKITAFPRLPPLRALPERSWRTRVLADRAHCSR
jgi:hypothetical protein